jgi:predicted ester cyclase
MSVADNKALYRRFIQTIFSEGQVERVGEFAAPNYRVREAPPGTPAGPDGIVQIVKMFRAGFSDLNLVIEELIGEGDWIAARATTHGTHSGTIFGIAPTGRKIAVTGLTMVKIVDGKLVESWVKNDVGALMAQLGAAPKP